MRSIASGGIAQLRGSRASEKPYGSSEYTPESPLIMAVNQRAAGAASLGLLADILEVASCAPPPAEKLFDVTAMDDRPAEPEGDYGRALG